MNKFGIKFYGNNIYHIDSIYYFVNSIKHHSSNTLTYKFRTINEKSFGIDLRIKNKKLDE